MTEGDKVFGSPPPWTDEMHEKWLKELKEMRPIVVYPKESFSSQPALVPLDLLIRGKQLLKEILNEQVEVISSPIRFNGVHIEKIKQIFEKYGIVLEQEF
jgi:hypothetical protein